MKEIASDLRLAVLNALEPLTLEGKSIPVFDELVNPNVPIPVINAGQCYVIIRDQSETETTNDKCQFRQNVNITFDIITKFPSNGGGKRLSELISEEIQYIILAPNISISGFNVISVRKSISRNLIEQGKTQTAYRKLISYIFDVYQND
jgi:hypothetical protein